MEKHVPNMPRQRNKLWISDANLDLIHKKYLARECENWHLELQLQQHIRRAAMQDRGKLLDLLLQLANGLPYAK